jgi:hypothetical protein
MPDNFSFDLNAIQARDEINDALSTFRSPNAGQMQLDPAFLQQLAQRVNVQGNPQMQQMSVNAPLGGGFNANMGLQRMGAQPNMPARPPQVTNVGVGYQSPGFSADIGYNPAQKGVGANVRVPFKKGGHVNGDDLAVKPDEYAEGGGAWTRKEGKNPEGGLNAKGRASLRAQGQDIKPPVSAKQAKKSPKAAARRKSFCARMGGMEGPMKDEKGRPTRKALALRKWDCKAEGGEIEVTGRREGPDLLSLQALEDFRMPVQGSGGGGSPRLAPTTPPPATRAQIPFGSTFGRVGPTVRGDRFQVSVGPGRDRSLGVAGRFQFADGGSVKPIWEKKRPDDLGDPKGLSVKKKASAKRRAKAAGRPYPNMVDNLAVARKKGK